MPLSALLYAAAALCGCAYVLQQTINAGLRASLGSPLFAGLANFLVGACAVGLVILALREPVPALAVAARAPWHAWIGGLLGALYIVGAVFLLPRIGAASLVGLVVVGQMLTALAFDHFGVLGLAVHEAGPLRLAGAALLILGAVLLCAG